MAAAAVVLLPIVILFAFAQKYFVEGIALTGLKG
jgi:multiple sugar transport system permease protein